MNIFFISVGIFIGVTVYSIALMAFGFKMGYEDAIDDANIKLTLFRKEMRARCECEECVKERAAK